MTYSTIKPGQKDSILDFVNKTLGGLMANFPAWKNSVLNNPEEYLKSYRRELIQAMQENGVNSDTMIAMGMKRARANGKPFLPAPGEFCEWCQPTPEDYGMPSPFDAFQEAMKKAGQHQSMRDTWSHNAVYLAAANTGFYELKKTGESDQRYRDIKKAFEAHYKRSSDKVIRGGILSVPPEHRVEVQKPIVTASSKSIGDSALNKLMGMFE